MTSEILDCAGNLLGRAVALHSRRPDDHVQIRKSIQQHTQDIAQARAAERGYDPDRARQKRQLAFACGIEEAFVAEAFLQLLESHLERARAARFHLFGIELQRAARLVDIDAAAHHDLHAVGGLEAEPTLGRGEHHDVDRCIGIFEGKK